MTFDLRVARMETPVAALLRSRGRRRSYGQLFSRQDDNMCIFTGEIKQVQMPNISARAAG